MPSVNGLIGDEVIFASESPEEARPLSPGGRAVPVADENRIAGYVAALVLFALLVLILIRVAGLQGMIAVGRPS